MDEFNSRGSGVKSHCRKRIIEVRARWLGDREFTGSRKRISEKKETNTREALPGRFPNAKPYKPNVKLIVVSADSTGNFEKSEDSGNQ